LKENSTSEAFKEFRQEISIHGKLNFTTTVQLHAICLLPLSIVTEFIPHGNLDDFVHLHPDFIPFRLNLKFLEDIAKGLGYMHSLSPPIAHLDIKLMNVMVYSFDYNDPACAKIIDFGTSKFCNGYLKDFTSVDNPLWLAPERINKVPYNEKVDTYAYGVMTWEFFTSERPWKDLFWAEVEDKVGAGERLGIPQYCHPIIKEVIEKSWKQDPKERPSYNEILILLNNFKEDIDFETNEQEFKKIIEERSVAKKEIENIEIEKEKKEIKKIEEMEKWDQLLEEVIQDSRHVNPLHSSTPNAQVRLDEEESSSVRSNSPKRNVTRSDNNTGTINSQIIIRTKKKMKNSKSFRD